MKHHFRLWAILGLCAAAYAVLLASFRLLNRPSDAAVVAGLSLLFVLLLIVPVAIRTIWRNL